MACKRAQHERDNVKSPVTQRCKKKQRTILTFDHLPLECRLHIFSFLSSQDKCDASTTCKLWAEILRTPCLWQNANFVPLLCCESRYHIYKQQTLERPSAVRTISFNSCSTLCKNLKTRVETYVNFLSKGNAQLKLLSFEFDLIEDSEQWLCQILQLLTGANCTGMEKVFGRWAFTPHCQGRSVSPSLDNKYSRVLSFHKFLWKLFEVSPCIQHFRIQFDWSMNSVKLLCKFQRIHTLELSKYWVFVTIPQSSIDALLEGLPNLKRLCIEMVTPFQRGTSHLLYTLRSSTLEELDIQRSSGFFLLSVNLPNLRSFVNHREYWAGPVLSWHHLNIPCLHTVLRDGAKNLQFYNGYPLNKHWREHTTILLEAELKSSCYCPRHKKGDLF
ncbi:hypothetical protein BSL78_04057 [Apostichopus japonicus]|uniref:F-box domain-containing protein n=1 Tax=Stichopus japonicus TaxID=307972 RepID=A0A2G8LFU1_STIJA|nr:hypothetical protein BSL78_04057 [Apostichopus japonicus]